MSGNEAIARGVYEAGVKVASAYPGTPSTEIFETLPQYKDDLYCEWAPNEKVATEVAYGASVAGVRSFTAMKHVGLNVAADPVFTAAYNGVGGGFVVVSADDPSMHSSQNEQDNRWYALHAKIPCIEPSDSQECLDFTKEAFKISEMFDMPVLLRTTTRVSHSKSLVEFGEKEEVAAKEYSRGTKYNCAPALAYRNRAKLEKNMAELVKYSNSCSLQKLEMNGSDIGVITSSIAYEYAKDVFPEDTSFLKIGLSNPMPMELIKDFAAKVNKLYVIEELDPFMEQQIKAAGIECIGKELVSNMYELNPQILAEQLFGIKPETRDPGVAVASRPPALCPGCPHRGFFYTMSKHRDFVVTGDIGCYTLGLSAPLNAADTCICMGAGFSLGAGMAKAFEAQGKKKTVFGVVGDSTFFHSGMTGALEIIYNDAGIIPVVLDNHITGMTGHQDNPGSGYNLKGEVANAIKVEDVLKSFGYENVIIVDPQDLEKMEEAVMNAVSSSVRSAIVCRRPCLLIKRIPREKGCCTVDTDKCVGCKTCLKVGCPAIMVRDKKACIDKSQCVGCTVCAQACPKGAISKEEA